MVMNLTKSCQKERLRARHGDDGSVKKAVEAMHKGRYSVLLGDFKAFCYSASFKVNLSENITAQKYHDSTE